MQQYFLSGNYNTDLIKGLMNGWMKYKLSLAAKLQQRAPRWLWGLICDVWSERRYGRTDWWEVRGGSQNSLVTEATEQQRGWSCTSCCVCVYRSTELPEGGAAVPWMGGGLLDFVRVFRERGRTLHTPPAYGHAVRMWAGEGDPSSWPFYAFLGIVAVVFWGKEETCVILESWCFLGPQ